jgi:conjugal transfer pilus assembly protein TraF
LYLVEPASGRILPVGYGVMSPSELEDRVDVVSDPQFAKNVPSAVQNIGQRQ